MKRLQVLILAFGFLLFAGSAKAFTPQTIVVDGVNDFDPSNLLNDDRGDTEIKDWCTADAANDSTMDIGRVYVTNDANFIYLGWEYFEDCFGDVQLGVAIDVDTPAGGVDDPFTRKIGWANLAKKPDSYLYLEQNAGSYQIYYRWTGTAWADSSALVAGSPSGSNALGAVVNTRFVEMKIPFTALRAGIGTTINLEFWMTQNGANKGPLDAMCSDAVQMSRGGQTTFDTTAVVQMTCMSPFLIQNAVDSAPPTVNGATAVAFPLLADKSFSSSTNKVDVFFNEPAQNPSAQTAANYVLTGPSAPGVVLAQRDGVNSSIVHLTLASTITAAAGFYNVTVQNVKDLAGNTIVANGNTNVGSFFIQALAFEANVKLRLCKGEFATTDTFAVEGNLAPLTFATVGDNARLYDANNDSVYTGTVPFSMMKDRTTGKAEADLLWKLSRKAPSGSFYEPGSDRAFHLTSDSAAVRILAVSWGDDQASNFTDKNVDVIFQIDTRRARRLGSSKFWLVGSELPLTFSRPGVPMKDDGVSPDVTANDSIYTVKVRFPPCTQKNVTWKVVYDSTATDTVYECPGQGDRNVYVNSDAYDIVGGPHGPLVLPARGINRCTVSDKAVCVIFKVLTSIHGGPPVAGDTIAVIGNRPPLSSDRPPSAAGIMRDDGVAPDAAAGDHLYTRAITFPDSTGLSVTFKYWWNKWTNFGFECQGFGDRSFNLDDVAYSAAVCQPRNIDIFNRCEEVTAVFDPPRPADAIADFAVLRQSFPNPSAPRTTIRFEMKRAAVATLTIYDVVGRRVVTLHDGLLSAGPHDLTWNGRDASGARVRAGLYVYELASGGERLSRRLTVTR